MDFIKQKQENISKKATSLQLQVSNPESSVWVSASAGTGKTHVLTQRILRLLLNDPFLKISEVLAITFTKAATMEMQNRLIEELSKWTRMPDNKLNKEISFLLQRNPTKSELINARTLLVKVLDDPIGLNISTIHSFCETLLRKFPIEAGIPSSFILIEERDERALLKKAWFKAINELSTDHSKLFTEVFSLLGEFSLEDAIRQILSGDNKNRFYQMLHNFNSLESFIENLKNEFNVIDHTEQELREFILKFSPEKREALKEIMHLAYSDKGIKSQGVANKLDTILASTNITNKLINEYTSIFLTGKNELRKSVFASSVKKSASFDVDEFTIQEGEFIINTLENITNIQSFKISKAIAILANRMFDIYKQEKLDLAMLDFNDLIEYAEILVNKTEVQDWIRYKLDSKIKHCLLDEAQDTDSQQWNILQAIIEEFYYGEGQHQTPRTTFAVGDMKQSIYRFRGANPEVFDNIRKDLDAKSSHINHDFRVVDMQTSFRSTKAVLNFVDEVFKDTTRKLALDGINKELEHKVYQISSAGRVEIAPILTKDNLPEEDSNTFYKIPKDKQISQQKTSLRRLNYQNIAKKIVHLFNTENFNPQDIIILVRNRTGMAELIEELTKQNIPHTGSDVLNLSKSLIVEDFLNFAKFLCFKDDLSLLSILKSPAFNISDDELFSHFKEYKKERKYKLFFNYIKTDLALADIHNTLQNFINLTNKVRVVDLYTHIINTLNLNEKFMALIAGDIPAQQHQVKETIQEFLTQIESFSDLSLLAFLHWFNKETITVKKNTANIKNAVRIMTCHGSKGLEAKAIFLPDCGTDSIQESRKKEKLIFKKSSDQKFDSSFIYLSGAREINKTTLEKDILTQQETLFFNDDMRLLYVALTRARSNIFISGIQNNKELSDKSWYSILHNVMSEKINEKTEGYSKLNDGTLVFKTPQLGEIEDNYVEIIETEKEILVPDWVYNKADKESSIQQERSSYNLTSKEYLDKFKQGKSTDYIYGNIVHKLLEELPNIDKSEQANYISKFLENKKDISNKDKLQKEILIILEKYSHLFEKHNSFSEVPIQSQTKTSIHSGTIDRITVLKDEVYIIDYKTGQKTPERLEKYIKQLQSYVNIISKIYPQKQIRPAILWISNQELELI